MSLYFNLIKKYISSEINLENNKSYLSYSESNNLQKSKSLINVCVVYPNTYETGVNNLGFLILCDELDKYSNISVDRSFYYKNFNEVRGFLSGKKLCDFDIVFFSISYELDVLNLNSILEKGGINNNNKPLIVVGGSAVMINPEICNNISDLVCLGDAEILIPLLIEKIFKDGLNIKALFNSFYNTDGFYFPNLEENNNKDYKIIRQKKLENIFSSPFISPYSVFKNTVLIDGGRGCLYDCKFCVTGNYFKPLIIPDATNFYKIINHCLSKGVNSFGIVSSCVAKIKNFKSFLSYYKDIKINLSSLRFEDIDSELLELLKQNKQNIITLAPETGSNSLRSSISKSITNIDIINKIKLVHAYKFSVKLYFMFGLPEETDNDLIELVCLIKELRKSGIINASIQVFVPKPHTPFSNIKILDIKILKYKKEILVKEFIKHKIPINTIQFSSIKEAHLEYKLCQYGKI